MIRPSRPFARSALAGALVLFGLTGACAAQADAITLPWGDAVAGVVQGLGSVLVPLAATAALTALARLTGPLRVLVTTTLVERLVRNVGDYAINAVAGAVRGQTLSVPVGSRVIASAVQRALDQAPGWLVRAAGGREGVGEKVFRSLPLEEAATEANTLAPALQATRNQRAPARP
ncbi:hypothetical protein [Methylobacterium sp. J-068]|uniref:hypothetical protein n=1 Tax=Methylobacterium sp. J-068 TaxID=2836649 RepID=UPI001FB9A6B4|nr:hypothetical protein [Methylobacterium sp. J-068]MCJ2033290.1 hypothetical protein [Methylobacterium sp. J-068]